MSKLILGLDMGTTSISAVALNESGRIIQAVTKTHHAAIEGLPTEYAEQNPERIRITAFAALKALSELCRGSEFLAIALTGQMHSTVILDGHGKVTGNVITWQDRRSVAEGAQTSLLAELQQRATDEAMLKTGCRLSPGYLGTTLFALRRLKQLPSHIGSVSFVADWIASCLTGNAPVTERSHAASSGLFDLVADDWSDGILQAAEIPREWLPPVVDSGAIVGTLNPAVAAELDLPSGLPVINAIGDNQASVLSALPDLEGSVLINIGTGGQIVWRIPQFTRQLPLDTRILPGNPDPVTGKTIPQFMVVGAGLCGGDAIAWVNRTIRRWLADFGSLVSEEVIWDRLQQLVAQATPAPELICEPFFRGTRYEPDRRGVIKGISVDNLSPATLLASVLTGIAQSMSDVWSTSPQSAANALRRVAMAGNAVKHNPLLVEAVRGHFGVPVQVARHSEEAATGTAMLAGVHLRIWRTIEDAREAVQQAAEV